MSKKRSSSGLTGKAIEPQAIVSLMVNVSNSVTVTGEVVGGGRIALTARGDRILDVIANSGNDGLKAPVHETFIELTRSRKTVRVPMQALLADPRENIYARPGNTMTVIHYPLTFTAVGATLKNAVISFDAKGMEEAIGKADGLSDDRADPEGVFVLRYEPLAVAKAYPGLTPAQAVNGSRSRRLSDRRGTLPRCSWRAVSRSTTRISCTSRTRRSAISRSYLA